MIKAVIFDFGGVIKPQIDTCVDEIAAAYNLSVAELIPELSIQVIEFQTGNTTEKEMFLHLSKKLNRSMPPNWQSLWRHSYQQTWSINWQIYRLIKQLRHKAIASVILSNTIPPHADISSAYGGYSFVDFTFLSPQINLAKPNIRAYQWVLSTINFQSNEVIFVDDSSMNIPPAKSLGMHTVHSNIPDSIVTQVQSIIDSN